MKIVHLDGGQDINDLPMYFNHAKIQSKKTKDPTCKLCNLKF